MLRKLLIGGAAAATLMLAGSGVALAVSDGSYSYDNQHCSAHADDATEYARAEPGCHSTTFQVDDGNGHDYLDAGVQQQPGHEDDPFTTDYYGADVAAEGAPTQHVGYGGDDQYQSGWSNPTADPSKGVNVYFGSDDNLDFGEHDNSPLGSGGPSDGGAIRAGIDPANMAWLAVIGSGDPATLLNYISHNPVPFVNAQIGMGADGHDMAITTGQHAIYSGGNPDDKRDAADYDGMTWDPATCSGPDDQAVDPNDPSKDQCQDADHQGWTLGNWHDSRGTTYAEPGVQIYEDPDPQGSPAEDTYSWPEPAAAVTTCGVYAGGGSATNLTGVDQAQAENPYCSDTNHSAG